MSDKPTVECGKCGFRYGACHIDLTQTPEDGCANCECEAKDATLAALSSYVGNGLGTEGVTTAEQYEARIREGIDRITGVEATRREKAESERDTLRAECDRLRGLVREAVTGLNAAWGLIDGFYPAHRRDYAALVARLGAE